MSRRKAEQMPLIELPPVQKARRRDKGGWPRWKVVTRCLDCPFTHEDEIQARDMATAKVLIRGLLAPPTKAHRHRYAMAAGPAA